MPPLLCAAAARDAAGRTGLNTLFWGRRHQCLSSTLLALLLSGAVSTPAHAQRAVPERARSMSAASRQADVQSVAQELREQAGGRIKRFYAERGFWPLWAETGSVGPSAQALLGFLETADLDGLDPRDYRVASVRKAVNDARRGDAAAVARAELQLSRAFAAYVDDMRRMPLIEMIYFERSLKPKSQSAENILRVAAIAPDFRAYVASMTWMSPHYVRLRKVLERARKQGMSNAELNRIRLNLDRARVLPGPWTRHVVVDAASGQLWYYQGGKQSGVMRVVVGRAETPTPMFAGVLHYAVLNPYWNVPVGLVQSTIAPNVLGGRSLRAMRMEVLSDWSATPTKVDAATVNWRAVADGTEQIRVRQRPGGANSMGKVKFTFPNDEGIYLHDTPDRALFRKSRRHFSDGCIRLEDAAGLGKWLLDGPMRTKSNDPEQLLSLPGGVPIFLTYLTVADGSQARVQFLADVYNRDAQDRN